MKVTFFICIIMYVALRVATIHYIKAKSCIPSTFMLATISLISSSVFLRCVHISFLKILDIMICNASKVRSYLLRYIFAPIERDSWTNLNIILDLQKCLSNLRNLGFSKL